MKQPLSQRLYEDFCLAVRDFRRRRQSRRIVDGGVSLPAAPQPPPTERNEDK